jgi:hypothetical protein
MHLMTWRALSFSPYVAVIKAGEREAEAGELQATSDQQARRIQVLVAQLDAIQAGEC